MSLILEALRKSEAERRRDSAPDVALELPPAPPRTRRVVPAWLWPALALALALAGGIVLAALRDWPTAGETAPGSVDATPAPAPALRDQAPPPPAPAVVPRAMPRPSPVVAMPASTLPPPPTPSLQAPPRAQPAAPPASDNDAPDIAATALPPVKLSMHMWDADPARRFVILDGQRMGEGDRAGGIEVISIDRKGVLIQRNGQRARVPIQ
ncbi:general secretion pathway protein GspB [Thermomonas paludicola]|uniref:general secretion pathway protein GspB n=1 Tax=Thermomonas paludicola TaxID=2884874 RepID=UPI002113CDE7|nr:general secretion pathway protein GspB [Thermomonas paludicola]